MRRLIALPDGLYQAVWRDVCAGFEIVDGKLVTAAPIVWKCRWLLQHAVLIGPVLKNPAPQ
jgi:hypothetical protein